MFGQNGAAERVKAGGRGGGEARDEGEAEGRQGEAAVKRNHFRNSNRHEGLGYPEAIWTPGSRPGKNILQRADSLDLGGL